MRRPWYQALLLTAPGRRVEAPPGPHPAAPPDRRLRAPPGPRLAGTGSLAAPSRGQCSAAQST
eukprot:7752315-Prorocentrum_lima.AAC.1